MSKRRCEEDIATWKSRREVGDKQKVRTRLRQGWGEEETGIRPEMKRSSHWDFNYRTDRWTNTNRQWRQIKVKMSLLKGTSQTNDVMKTDEFEIQTVNSERNRQQKSRQGYGNDDGRAQISIKIDMKTHLRGLTLSPRASIKERWTNIAIKMVQMQENARLKPFGSS
jgi:hypothetical protein